MTTIVSTNETVTDAGATEEGTIVIPAEVISRDALVREYLDFLEGLHPKRLDPSTAVPEPASDTESGSAPDSGDMSHDEDTGSQLIDPSSRELSDRDTAKAAAWQAVLASAGEVYALQHYGPGMRQQEGKKRQELTERYWSSCPESESRPGMKWNYKTDMDVVLQREGDQIYGTRWNDADTQLEHHKQAFKTAWYEAVDGPLLDTKTDLLCPASLSSLLQFRQAPNYHELEEIYMWDRYGQTESAPDIPTNWLGSDITDLLDLTHQVWINHEHAKTKPGAAMVSHLIESSQKS
ncbi:uncharacterized protein I303_103394 [Kwoniella dejecticola CBS 10117]|uniref:Uncharacterized protein n=1 Tax=Kwoniella dejecticola CBS 10117 TaxID=1296121 RepID=A0A1A6A6M0_9TREE|nr:uncharacterized protein I303_03417 [Kwoniella dejecticola CBS 10117]OBR85706.1 hypothetical protein I303_03417 [Kwoniella dejecticola CBS 10117]